MTAPDCYRFCLSNPMSIWCLRAPKTVVSSRKIYGIFVKKVRYQRKKITGLEITGKLFTRAARGLHSGF